MPLPLRLFALLFFLDRVCQVQEIFVYPSLIYYNFHVVSLASEPASHNQKGFVAISLPAQQLLEK